MSKRSEEAAMEAYPVEMVSLNYQDLIDQFGGKTEMDFNTYPRRLFQQGYEQAEKDIKSLLIKKIRKTAIWNTIKVGKKEIRNIVTEIIESI